MRFRMEVRGVATGPAYLLVQAPVGTTWSALAEAVRRELALDERVAWQVVGGGALAPWTTVGVAPLLDGVAVTASCGPTRTVAAPGGRVPPPRFPLAHLLVTGGPDTGREFLLAAGTHVLGRSSRADLRIDDPGLSRRHAVLAVTPDGVRVHDLGSANGTRVDDAAVGAVWTPVGDGCLLAGRSSFRLRPALGAPSPISAPDPDVPSRDGLVPVPVPPAAGSGATPRPSPDAVPCRVIRYPAAPPAPTAGRAVLVTALAPLAMAIVLAVTLRTWFYLAFGLLGPVTLLGHQLLDRRAGRSGQARRRAEYAAALAETDLAVAAALDRERHDRQRDHPPLTQVLTSAATRGPALWQGVSGRDEWSVRVGCGTVSSQLAVERDGRTRRLELAETPLAVRLDGRATALCGPSGDVAGLTRAIIIQLAVRHDPDRFRLRLSPAARRSLGEFWPAWLPQLATDAAATDAARDLAVVRCERDGRTPRPRGTRGVLVLVDGPGLTAPDWCESTVRIGPDGVVVRTAETPAEAPAAPCDGAPVASGVCTGRAELLTADRADAAARALAPLRPLRSGHPADEAPQHLLAAVGLPDDVDALTDELRQRWSTPDRDTARILLGVRLGDTGGPETEEPETGEPGIGEPGIGQVRTGQHRTAEGARTGRRPCELDLDRDGPHLLLAGITGSGKSELLQTLVAGLVLDHPPEDLALVLLDYKGGSTFAPFADLPHTVGLLTDLEPEATARALRALGAELRHRETLIRAAGVADTRGYRAYRRRHPDLASMPRLVVVVDEFRVLAEDHPSALSALVRIAGLGRGLGVHLVLATQRPGGIVSAEIRANVNARIALRVRDVAESHDVLDVGDAARLDPHTPGHGYLRIGSSPPAAFQAVRAAVSARPAPPEPLRVTRRTGPGPAPERSAPVGPARDGDQGTTDLGADRVVELIVAAATVAARHDGHHRPPPVWAPPLPELLAIAPPGASERETSRDVACAGAPVEPAWPFGLGDASDGRRVDPLLWRPLAQGHLALVGTATSGRTGAVRAFLAALSADCPGRVRVAVVDAAGGLGCAGDLPHCAGLADLDDLGGVRRLLDRVTIDSRDPDGPCLTLLVLHGWERLCAAFDRLDHGRTTAALHDLLRTGATERLRVLVTGDRGLLTGAVGSLVEHKVVLRLADPRDALLAGVRPAPGGAPGRGVHLPGGTVVQLAAATPEEVRQAGTTARAAHVGCRFAPRPPALPRRLALGDIAPGTDPDLLIIGRDTNGEPAWVDAGACLLVTGPPGSGRTTTLATIAHAARAQGRVVHRVRAELDLAAVTPPGGPGRTVPVVLVDDLDDLPGPVVERLGDLQAEGVSLMAAARTSSATQTFTGTLGRLRRGDALILSPAPADGQLVGVTLGPGEATMPGRAALVRRGRVQVVQVAVAEPQGPPPGVPEPDSHRSAPTERPHSRTSVGRRRGQDQASGAPVASGRDSADSPRGAAGAAPRGSAGASQAATSPATPTPSTPAATSQ